MPERKLSEFNEASFQIQRLHNAWLDCRRLRESGNLEKWKWALDSVEIELSVDSIDNEGELEDVNKKLSGIKEIKLEDFYLFLKEKEKLLRKIQDKAGKGGKYKDPDDDNL